MTLPNGSILMWTKPANTIPDGWFICNGSNGTPDLRDKFIYGASTDLDVGANDSTKNHVHTVPAQTEVAGEHIHKVTVNLNKSNDGTVTVNNYDIHMGVSTTHTHDTVIVDTSTDVAHSHTLSTTNSATHSLPYLMVYYIMRGLE